VVVLVDTDDDGKTVDYVFIAKDKVDRDEFVVEDDATLESITVSPTSITVNEGAAEPDYDAVFTVTANYSDGSVETVDASWTSTVDMNTPGTYTVTATYKGKTATANVIVRAEGAEDVTVTLTNTASGIGKNATVTLAGYDNATHYRILNAAGTALTGDVAVGTSVVVMFLNPGDECQVVILDGATVLDTVTVTAQ
jgi:hypothetical protein